MPVLLYYIQRGLSHWDNSFFSTFPKNTHGFTERVEIGDVQR